MNHNELNNMELLESKQLVLRISGAVESSNLAEFEETAMMVIGSIKTDLQTDDDFAEAESNIKSCQLIESRIHNARQDAINSTASIATLIATTERLEAKFRETRLLLNSKVKTEKEARKNEIISNAKNVLAGLLIHSPVKHAFVVDQKAILEAAKGKRSLMKMAEAIAEVIESETLRLANLETDFQANMSAISKAELEYPGIFPDKMNVALSPVDVVSFQIESRVATFKYNLEMKAAREREAAEALEKENERRRKEAAERAELEKKKLEDAPMAAKEPEPPTTFTDSFIPPPPPIGQTVTLVVFASTTDIDRLIDQISSLPGVIAVENQ